MATAPAPYVALALQPASKAVMHRDEIMDNIQNVSRLTDFNAFGAAVRR